MLPVSDVLTSVRCVNQCQIC